jgi:hypothetical protein
MTFEVVPQRSQPADVVGRRRIRDQAKPPSR